MSAIKDQIIETEERAAALRGMHRSRVAITIERMQRVREDLSDLVNEPEGVSEMLERDCLEARAALKHVIRGLS
jgi:hypothetical protein